MKSPADLRCPWNSAVSWSSGFEFVRWTGGRDFASSETRPRRTGTVYSAYPGRQLRERSHREAGREGPWPARVGRVGLGVLGRCRVRARPSGNLPLERNELDITFPHAGPGDVVAGLHPHQRIHRHAEWLLDPERHFRRETRALVEKRGQRGMRDAQHPRGPVTDKPSASTRIGKITARSGSANE